MKSKTWWLALLIAAPIVACGPPPADDDDDNVTIETYADIQSEVFNKSCALSSSCHTGPNPAASLSLNEGNSCDALVGVPSTQVSAIRVVAGDSASSYIVDKLLDRNLSTTDPMPPPGGGLEQYKIDAIVTWIDDDNAACP